MDSTVVNVIANELGIAIDNAEQFITDILPRYAAMESAELILFVACWSLVLFALVIAWLMVYKRWAKKQKEKNYPTDMGEFVIDHLISTIIVGTFIVLYFVAVPIIVCSGIGWFIAPDAKFLELVLESIK